MASTQQLLLGEGAGGAEKVYVEDVFSTYLYTGTGGYKTITNGIDLATKGGMIWLKGRTNPYGASIDNVLFSTADITKYLSSNTTDAYTAQNVSVAKISSVNTDGFECVGETIGANTNTYASWTFRKQPKFFDVVTYTGTGSARTVTHNLGSTPGCIIVKRTSGVANWVVYHRSIGATKAALLNSTAAPSTGTTFWNDTAPTSTQFTVGDSTTSNANAETYVAYLFAHDAGGFGLTGTDNVISCGSYTDGTGVSVNLGFEPQFLLVKAASTSGSWVMMDSMRGMSMTNDYYTLANSSAAESNFGTAYFQPTATGFYLPSPAVGAGQTVIYIAIRRGPMKVPTDATKVFDTKYAYSSSPTYRNTILTDGFIQFAKESGYNKDFYSRLTGTNYLSTNLTAAESTNASLKMDIMNGVYTAVSTPPTYMAWMFRRAPSFFDEVCYTGNGSTQDLSHNLGVVPEMMIVKKRSATGSWVVYTATTGNASILELQSTGAVQTAAPQWNTTTPTASVFSLGSSSSANASGSTYVNYLFATCAGVSKVFNYTGNGSSQTINCGFTGGARWVMIKRTDSTGDWYIWDSSRGIVSGNDPHLSLNTTAAEVTSDDTIDTDSTGFIVNQLSATNVNVTSATYIGIAIA